MKSRVCSFLIVAFSCLTLLTACADVESEEVKLKVTGYSGVFIGSYILDSGDDVSFEGGSIGNDVFSYEKLLEVDDQLEVEVTPKDASGDSLSSLEIKIYRDNTLIKSVEDISEPVQQISLIYTSGETAETK
jgi:hypothetical protein